MPSPDTPIRDQPEAQARVSKRSLSGVRGGRSIVCARRRAQCVHEPACDVVRWAARCGDHRAADRRAQRMRWNAAKYRAAAQRFPLFGCARCAHRNTGPPVHAEDGEGFRILPARRP